MNKKELFEAVIELPVDCSGSRPKIDKLTTLELIKLLDEPQKVVVPQFVANWIANVKRNGFKFRNSSRFYEEIVSSDDVYRVMYYILKESIAGEAIRIWVNANRDAFARAWLDGYEEVEEEKRYRVKFIQTGQHLAKNIFPSSEYFVIKTSSISSTDSFTRKELEQAGFGEVFNSTLFEVEEVED